MNRKGFTLIELMGVIVVIAILIAVSLPAFNAVVRRARTTTARADLTAISSSIAQFNSQFGTVPPSYVSFIPAGGEIPPQTKAVLRQMFPQIDFVTDANTNGTPDIYETMSAQGVLGKEYKGNEALVFFLGGIRRPGSTEIEMVGFSKNPMNPFLPPSGSSTRVGPFIEFKGSRLRLRTAGEVPATRVGNVVYVDNFPSQTAPILYASNSTGGFNESHIRATPKTASPTSLSDFFNDGFLPLNDGAFHAGDFATGTPDALRYGFYKNRSGSPISQNGFVLVSPGTDGEYGRGGFWNEDGDPFYTDGTPEPSSAADDDNLTNFTGSTISE